MNRGNLEEVIRDIFKPKSKRAAEKWTRDIAQVVDRACELIDGEFAELGLEEGEWEAVYKPALLWQFYRHLGAEMNQLADGHALALTRTLKEGLDVH